MPINPRHAEEYELPELGDHALQGARPEDAERDGLLRRNDSEEKLGREAGDGEETDDRPLLGSSGAADDDEPVGKGTKIDQLIARVCILSVDLDLFTDQSYRPCPRLMIRLSPRSRCAYWSSGCFFALSVLQPRKSSTSNRTPRPSRHTLSSS